MNKFNPNKLVFSKQVLDDIQPQNGLTIEFYSNAREVVLNGTRYAIKPHNDTFIIDKRIK